MGIEARVVGNLLTNPEQKTVKVKGEPKKVTTLRIMAAPCRFVWKATLSLGHRRRERAGRQV
ncbi:MAG: hypothetical protein ACK4F8_11095, partial [Aquabacterium sp.]